MAELELQKCAMEAIDCFSIRYVAATHAIGRVAVGEASVVIAVSSNHRSDAFTACRFIIDVLKERVPIWKQEMWADGTTWKEGNLLQQK
jgi:molybdopterin synthase catalytic subunit